MEIKVYIIPRELGAEREFQEIQKKVESLNVSIDDYIILNCKALDDLSPETLEYVEKGLEVYLRSFATLLTGAAFLSLGQLDLKAIEIIEEGLDTIKKRLSQLAQEKPST